MAKTTTQQVWLYSTSGGFFTNNRLSAQLRYATEPIMKFRQFVSKKEAWGKGKGDKLYWNKISRINTAGGTLIETDTIPEHAFYIARGSLVLSEWGNALPYTGKLEALSEYDPTDPIAKVLRDDMAQVLDKSCGKQYKLTRAKYTGTSTAAGTVETRGQDTTLASGKNVKGGWRIVHIDDCVAQLKRKQIPPFADGDYICIAAVNFLRELRKDTNWKNAVYYGDPERAFAGEVGRISGVRFIEENNYLVNTIGSGGNYGEAVMFGDEAVAEGVCVPEEIRAKVPTDFGRSKGLSWYSILGWTRMWRHGDTNQWEHIIHLTGKG